MDDFELVLVLAIVIVPDTRQQLGQRRGRHGLMAFDHEKLDLYRLAVLFSSWVGERLDHRKPAIASGPGHENKYEHDDDCEHESCLAKA